MDKPSQVKPIAARQQSEMIDLTLHYIDKASELYHQCFAAIPILFDLRGRSAGMYQRRGDQKKIATILGCLPRIFSKAWSKRYPMKWRIILPIASGIKRSNLMAVSGNQ